MKHYFFFDRRVRHDGTKCRGGASEICLAENGLVQMSKGHEQYIN